MNMAPNKPCYSIIIPVYQAQAHIVPRCLTICTYLLGHQISFELILVDDASRDLSWQKIQEIPDLVPIVRIRQAKNRGQHWATYAGILAARGTYILTVDDDSEISASAILSLIQQQDAADLCYGISQNQNKWMARIGSWTVNRVLQWWFQFRTKGSSVRLFKRSLIPRSRPPRFLFIDILLLSRAKTVIGIPISRIYQPQKTRYTFRKKLFQLWCLIYSLAVTPKRYS